MVSVFKKFRAQPVGQDALTACPVKVNMLLEMFTFHGIHCEIKLFNLQAEISFS
jgi:hypothetical protein